jgi:hypothetical protein
MRRAWIASKKSIKDVHRINAYRDSREIRGGRYKLGGSRFCQDELQPTVASGNIIVGGDLRLVDAKGLIMGHSKG